MKFLNNFFVPSVDKLRDEYIAAAERAAFAASRLAEEYQIEAAKQRLVATAMLDRVALLQRDRIDTLTAEQDAAVIAEGADK